MLKPQHTMTCACTCTYGCGFKHMCMYVYMHATCMSIILTLHMHSYRQLAGAGKGIQYCLERERERERGKGETYSWAGSLLGEDGVRGDERPSMSSGELTRSFRSCSYKKLIYASYKYTLSPFIHTDTHSHVHSYLICKLYVYFCLPFGRYLLRVVPSHSPAQPICSRTITVYMYNIYRYMTLCVQYVCQKCTKVRSFNCMT